MTTPLTVSRDVHFRNHRHGRRELVPNARPEQPAPQPGRVPRVARLAALALHFERLIRTGAVASYADVATLGHVTRARISQIMNLLNLAPDVLEAVLFLPRIERGRDTIHLRDLQPIASTFDWGKQRRQWRELQKQRSDGLVEE
jgi:hypothetical protein